MSATPLEEMLTLSEHFLAGLDALIKEQILNSFLDKIPGVDQVARSIEHGIAESETLLLEAEKYVKNQIEPALSQAVTNPISLLTSLTGSLDTHLTDLLGNIASASDVTGSVINVLKQNAPDLAKWIYTEISGGFGQTLINVLKLLETQDNEGIDAVLDEFLSVPGLPPYLHKLAFGFRHRGAEWQAFALPVLLGGILLGGISAVTAPAYEAIGQGAWELLPTKEAGVPEVVQSALRQDIGTTEFLTRMARMGYDETRSNLMLNNRKRFLDPDLATRAYFKGLIPHEQWEGELVRQGFDTERARIHWLEAQRLLGEDYIRGAYLRGAMTAAQHDARLEQYGFNSDNAKLMRDLYFYIPPVADLIHMGIRNVFNPEIVARFELDGDYPVPFEHAAHQQGVSSEWAHKYWQAHWIMPGREAFFELFQRTSDTKLDPGADTITLSDGTEVHNLIGRDTLNLALRDIDTPPFYRNLLTQLAYRPLTRIDIRRMAQIGQLSHAQVERAYLDLGYNQHNARRLADFTDTLAKKTSKDAATRIIDNLKSHTIQLYIAGKLSEEAVKSTLEDMLFTDAEITALIAEAEIIRASQMSTILENGIGKLYIAGIVTDVDAIKRMTEAGIPVDAQSLLFQKWDLEIQYRGGTEHIHKHKDLVKSEIVESYVDGLMDASVAKGMLLDLGYNDLGAEAELALADFRAAKQARTTIIDAIKAKYINGVSELLETSNALDTIGMPSDQRDGYLSEWTLQRETRTERIPIATLRDMYRTKFIDAPTVIMHLKRHRYTDDDAALTVAFWGSTPTTRGQANAV